MLEFKCEWLVVHRLKMKIFKRCDSYIYCIKIFDGDIVSTTLVVIENLTCYCSHTSTNSQTPQHVVLEP